MFAADDCGDAQRAGSFRFFLADRRWEWSLEVGHPDDCDHLAAALEETVRTARPFSTRHRIIDAQGCGRDVVVVGDGLRDDHGEVIGTYGYCIDVTPSTQWAHQQSVAEAVAEISVNRRGIEQAKGMLMLIYRIHAEAAFDLLKWRSQVTNVKLRVIAEQIVKDFLALSYSEVLPPRSTYDHLLMTAHERIGGAERRDGTRS